MTSRAESLGRELARHGELSHRDCAELLRALAAGLGEPADGDAPPEQFAGRLPPGLQAIFHDCVLAYRKPAPQPTGLESLGHELGRHGDMAGSDLAIVLLALSHAAAQIEIDLWDRYEFQKTVQRLPLALREPFAALVEAYARDRR